MTPYIIFIALCLIGLAVSPLINLFDKWRKEEQRTNPNYKDHE